MSGSVETEIKLRVADGQSMAARLTKAGLRVHVQRVFEVNTLYDTSDQRLRTSGSILRLREVDGCGLLTYKGQEQEGPHKTREEVETGVSSIDSMRTILTYLGHQPVFRYEKFRTEYKFSESDEGVVTLDHTPIGDFLELEGASAWIDATAQRLGYAVSDYVLDSYGKLYIADCERRGVKPTNMVFSS